MVSEGHGTAMAGHLGVSDGQSVSASLAGPSNLMLHALGID